MTDTDHEHTPVSDDITCRACGLKHSDIARLKLDWRFRQGGHYHDLPLSLCSRCDGDVGAITVALTRTVTATMKDERKEAELGALFALRDRMLFKPFADHVFNEGVGSNLKAKWELDIDGRVEHLEQKLHDTRAAVGFKDCVATDVKRKKLGLAGAALGAMFGFMIGHAKSPLGALRAGVKQLNSTMAQIDEMFGGGDGKPPAGEG